MAKWRIRLGGGLAVEVDGRPIERFETRRVAALLAFLALHPDRGHDRDRVADLLWPGEEIEPQRARFRQALAALRRALQDPEGEILSADRVQIRLSSANAHIDVLEFRRHLERDDLEAAVQIDPRDLIPEIPDEWAEADRAAHRDQLCRAILDLAARWDADGKPEEAATVLARLRKIDPIREDGAREAVRLLAKAGRYGDAAQLVVEYEATLRTQLGVSPSPEFHALAEKVRRVSHRRVATTGLLHESGEAVELPTASPNVPTLKSNVRPALTPIFGRERDVETVLSWLDQAEVRLVTLHGPGGIGKTRLAQEVALKARETYGEAVWLVTLAHIQDPGLVLPTVLDTLGAARGTRRDEDLIAAHLHDRPTLIVLDNLEQFIDVAAEPVQRLLEECPSVKVIATSRHLLGVGFETVYSVGPLAATGEGATSPDVHLFLERARRQSPTFAYTPEVTELCRQLDGIPLAIALAATRVNVLSPGEMIAQLPQRFDLLVSSRRDLPDRHRTLRASLEWSYQLLPDLKATFARLSVFAGSFDLRAAGYVAESGGMLDEVQIMVERSLVEEEDRSNRKRFRMLETVRQFAYEQLSETACRDVKSRHAAYFAALAAEADREQSGGDHKRALEIFGDELDNFRTAHDWAVVARSSLGLEICAYLGVFWHIRGMYAEARHRYDGLYLRRVDGPVLADLQEDTSFYPSSTMKVFMHAYAIWNTPQADLATRQIPVWNDHDDLDHSGDTFTNTALPNVLGPMMLVSDNQMANTCIDFWGANTITNFCRNTLGASTKTQINHMLGIGRPYSGTTFNSTTLVDLGNVYENVNSLYGTTKRNFFRANMLNDANSNGIDSAATDARTALGITNSQWSAWRSNYTWHSKAGSNPHPTLNISGYTSAAGYLTLPFRSPSGTVTLRNYVFGVWINDAKTTNTAGAWGSATELIRDEVEASLASFK